MKKLGIYTADKGSLVINGVAIGNNYGDGEFYIFYEEDENALFVNFKNVSPALWFDLRFTDLELWTYDCDKNCKKITLSQNTINAEALQLYVDCDGNFLFKKYF